MIIFLDLITAEPAYEFSPIFEVGMVITNNRLEGMGTYESPIYQPAVNLVDISYRDLIAFSDSGLLGDVQVCEVSLREVERHMCAILDSCTTRRDVPVLASHNTAIIQSILLAQLPELADLMHSKKLLSVPETPNFGEFLPHEAIVPMECLKCGRALYNAVAMVEQARLSIQFTAGTFSPAQAS